MRATSVLALTIVLLSFGVANSASAQLRVEDRVKIGDIAIKYDSNRWLLASGNSATKAQLDCRGRNCGIVVRIEVEDKSNVCRAETVSDLMVQQMSRTTKEEFTPYDSRPRKTQRFGTMTVQTAMAYNRSMCEQISCSRAGSTAARLIRCGSRLTAA